MRNGNFNPKIEESQIENTESDNDKEFRSSGDVEKIEKELVTLFATIIVNHVLKDRYEKGNPISKI